MTAVLTDPVCGMDVTPGAAAGGSAEHAGTIYWFCNPSCRERFIADPARFLHLPASPPIGPGSGKDTRVYTCPMHPEVRQVGPGSCPKCGMALEPLEVTADEGAEPRARGHDPALLGQPGPDRAGARARDGRRCSRRGWWPRSAPPRGSGPSSSWPRRSCCGAAGRSSCAAGQSLVTRNLNMFTLIALGTGAAFAFSVLAVLFPDALPARDAPRRRAAGVLRGRGRHHHAGPARARCWSCGPAAPRPAPSARCSGLPPKTARRLRADGSEEDVPLEHVAVGRSAAGAAGRAGAGGRRGAGRARARWTSRWSPASRSRWRRSRATA